MDVFNRPQALIVIIGLLFICETGMGANLTSRHVSGTYSRNLYNHVEVSREIQIQLPPTWDRKNVKLMARLAVFQMLHDTSQGIDILSKKNLFWFFSCVLLAFRSSSDWFCHRKCLSRNWVCSACACVCASAAGMCVKKVVRGVRVQRWARL